MSDTDAYRRGSRDENKFKQDISIGHKKEKAIMEKFAQIVERNSGMKPVVEDNGCDNSGRWMPADRINTRADFLFNGKPFEVKFSNPWTYIFHFKVGQIRSYIAQNAYMLYVHGYDTSHPRYFLFTPNELLEMTRTHKPVIFWEKECYELRISELNWTDFQ